MADTKRYWFINHQKYLNIVEGDSDGDLVSPTEVKTVRIHCRALYPQVDTVDTSDLLLPLEHEDVLLEGLKAEVFEMLGDMKSARMHKAQFEIDLKEMKAQIARGMKNKHTMLNYDL